MPDQPQYFARFLVKWEKEHPPDLRQAVVSGATEKLRPLFTWHREMPTHELLGRSITHLTPHATLLAYGRSLACWAEMYQNAIAAYIPREDVEVNVILYSHTRPTYEVRRELHFSDALDPVIDGLDVIDILRPEDIS